MPVAIAALIVATSASGRSPRYHKTFVSANRRPVALDAQQRIADDLAALVSARMLTTACLPISVPYATPMPLLALRPAHQPGPDRRRTDLHAAPTRHAAHSEPSRPPRYQLDVNDPAASAATSNRSWRV